MYSNKYFGKGSKLAIAAAAGCLVLSGCSGSSGASANGDILIGLITKTETTPFFAAMSEAAKAEAKKQGIQLQTYAGTSQVDTDSQVSAIEDLIAAHADAIMITAIDPVAIAPQLQRAKDAGIPVIALDTPLTPTTLADSTIATDNFKAGELIGQYAKAAMTASGTYDSAHVALLDMSVSKVSLDVDRDQGFMSGFGFDIADKGTIGDEPSDPRIVGHEVTDGDPAGGRRAMENLLQSDPDINLVYAMSEQPANGAYEAIAAAGKSDSVSVVAIDGECAAVDKVAAGQFDAISMQFPATMATLGVRAVVDHVRNGTPFAQSVDSGVQVYAANPVDGVDVKDIAWAKQNCWG
ncbi:substrate-binding domain-containing protein [Nocardioides sp.]|uniref:substrate-binding domain-containing protein n=1 Tax=Nocardioides sp. TaxID=35761 RepID=UPI0031FE9917|nr:putative transporter substrate-binding protein [Nocardioides sp.]